MERIKQLLTETCTALLTGLWVYAAVSKLADFTRFGQQMHRQPLPAFLQEVLPYVLPPAELLLAVLLAFAGSRRAGLLGSGLLLLLFTGYVGLVMTGAFGRVPCACGGLLQHLGWGLHLAFNLFFLALTTTTIILQQRKEGRWQLS